MRAIIFDEPGEPEVLRVARIPDPEPGPRDLLVRNFAAGMNRADLLQRRGRYPPPPGESEILGLEFAGEVLEAGADVRGFDRGDRVFGLLGGGGYAELVRVNHQMAMPIPDTFSFEKAAAVPEAFFTAGEALFELGGLSAGQAVMIHAAAGGVGTAALQLAADAGATVLATAGTEEKRSRCRKLGAAHALDYHQDFAREVEKITSGRGVDVILDLVGGTHWDRNLRALAPGGRLLVVGLLGGSRAALDLGFLLRRGLQVIGTTLRGRRLEEKIALTGRFRSRVLPRLEAGAVSPVLDRVFLLEEAQEAHRYMEKNLNTGKIVLRF